MASRDPQGSKSLHSSYSDILFGRTSPCPPQQDPTEQNLEKLSPIKTEGAIGNIETEKNPLGRILVQVDTGQGHPYVVVKSEQFKPEHKFREERKTVRPYSRLNPLDAAAATARLRSSSADPPRDKDTKESFFCDQDILPSRPQSAVPPILSDHDLVASSGSTLNPSWDSSGKCLSYAEISFRQSQSDLSVPTESRRGQVETGESSRSDVISSAEIPHKFRNPRKDIFATMGDFRSEKSYEKKPLRADPSKLYPSNSKQSDSLGVPVTQEMTPEPGEAIESQGVEGYRHPTIPGLIFPGEEQTSAIVPVAPARKKRKGKTKPTHQPVFSDFEPERVVTRRDQLARAPEMTQDTPKSGIQTIKSESQENIPQLGGGCCEKIHSPKLPIREESTEFHHGELENLTNISISEENIQRFVPNYAESGQGTAEFSELTHQPLQETICECSPSEIPVYETAELEKPPQSNFEVDQVMREIDWTDQLHLAQKFRPVILSCPTTIEEIEQLEVLDCNESESFPHLISVSPKEQISEMSIVFSNPNSFKVIYPTPLDSAGQAESIQAEPEISNPTTVDSGLTDNLDQSHTQEVLIPEIIQEPLQSSSSGLSGRMETKKVKGEEGKSKAIMPSSDMLLPESLEMDDTNLKSEFVSKEILPTAELIDVVPSVSSKVIKSENLLQSEAPTVESVEGIDRIDSEQESYAGTHEAAQRFPELQLIASSISSSNQVNTPTTPGHENENNRGYANADSRDVSQVNSANLGLGLEGIEHELGQSESQVEKYQKTDEAEPECSPSVRVTSPIVRVSDLGQILHMLSYAEAEYRYKLYLAQKEIDDDMGKAVAALDEKQPQEIESNVIIKSTIDSLNIPPEKVIIQASESEIPLSACSEAEKDYQVVRQDNTSREIIEEISSPVSSNNLTEKSETGALTLTQERSKDPSDFLNDQSLQTNLYLVPSFLLQTTELNLIERNWREKLAAKEEIKKKQVNPVVKDSPKPPPSPDGDDRNNKFDPKGNDGNNDPSGHGGTTRLQYTGLTGLMSNWLDWSTHLRSDPLIPDKIDLTTENESTALISSQFIDFNPEPDLDPYANYNDTSSHWDNDKLEDYRAVDCDNENRNFLSEEYLQRIKSLLSGDTDTLQEEIDAQVRKIEELVSSQDLLDATVRYKEILRSLKGLEPSLNSWKDILGNLPQDPEVKEITRDVIDLSMHLKALITQTGKLSKAAEFRATKLEAMNNQRQPDVHHEPESMSIQNDEVDTTKSQISEQIPQVQIIPQELANYESVFENVGGLESGRETVMNSLEITTTQIPEKQVTFESETAGGHVVTRMQRSGFVTQKREVSIVQSVHGLGVVSPADDNDASRGNSPTCQEPESLESEIESDSIIVRDIRSASPMGRPDVSEGTLSLELIPGDISNRLAMVELPDENTGGLTVTVRQVTKHVTRRVIRKRRRIIRKIVTVNGVEKITEEIIEEPDEVDEHTSEMTCAPIVDISGGYSPDLQFFQDTEPRTSGLSITEVSDSSLGVATAESLSGVEATDAQILSTDTSELSKDSDRPVLPADSTQEPQISQLSEKPIVTVKEVEDQHVAVPTKESLKETVKESQEIPGSTTNVHSEELSPLPSPLLEKSDQAQTKSQQSQPDQHEKGLAEDQLPQAKTRKKKKGFFGKEVTEPAIEIALPVSIEAELTKKATETMKPPRDQVTDETTPVTPAADFSQLDLCTKLPDKSTGTVTEFKDQGETLRVGTADEMKEPEIIELESTEIPALDQAKEEQFPLEDQSNAVTKEPEPLPQAKLRKKKKTFFGKETTEQQKPATEIGLPVPIDSELPQEEETTTAVHTSDFSQLDLSTKLPDKSTTTVTEFKDEEETIGVEIADELKGPEIIELESTEIPPVDQEKEEQFSLDNQSKVITKEPEPFPPGKSRKKKKGFFGLEVTEPATEIALPVTIGSDLPTEEAQTRTEVQTADLSELDLTAKLPDKSTTTVAEFKDEEKTIEEGTADELKEPEIIELKSTEVPALDQGKEEQFPLDDQSNQPLPQAKSRKKKKGLSKPTETSIEIPALVPGDSDLFVETENVAVMPSSDPLDVCKEKTGISESEPHIIQLPDQPNIEETQDQKLAKEAETETNLPENVVELKSDELKSDSRQGMPVRISNVSEEELPTSITENKSPDKELPLDSQAEEPLPKAKSRKKKKRLSGVESKETSIEFSTDSELPKEVSSLDLSISSADPSNLSLSKEMESPTEVFTSESITLHSPDKSIIIEEEAGDEKLANITSTEVDRKLDEITPIDSTEDISDKSMNVHTEEFSTPLSEDVQISDDTKETQSEVLVTEPSPQAKSRKKRKGKKTNEQQVPKDLDSGAAKNIVEARKSISTEASHINDPTVINKGQEISALATDTPEAIPDLPLTKNKIESIALPESQQSEVKPSEEKIGVATKGDETSLPVSSESEIPFPSITEFSKGDDLSQPDQKIHAEPTIKLDSELIISESEEIKELSQTTDSKKKVKLQEGLTTPRVSETPTKDSFEEVTHEAPSPSVDNLNEVEFPERFAAQPEVEILDQSELSHLHPSGPSTSSFEISLSAMSFIPGDYDLPNLDESDKFERATETEPGVEKFDSKVEGMDELELKPKDKNLDEITGSEIAELSSEASKGIESFPQSSDKAEIESPVLSTSNLIPESETIAQGGIDTDLDSNTMKSLEPLPGTSAVGLVVEPENIAGILDEEYQSSPEDSLIKSTVPEKISSPEIFKAQEELIKEQQPSHTKDSGAKRPKKKSRKRKNDKERTPPVEAEIVVVGIVSQEDDPTRTLSESVMLETKDLPDIESVTGPISEGLSKSEMPLEKVTGGQKLVSSTSVIFPESSNLSVYLSAQDSPSPINVYTKDFPVQSEVAPNEQSEFRDLLPSSLANISENQDCIRPTILPEDISGSTEDQTKLSTVTKSEKSDSFDSPPSDIPESFVDDKNIHKEFHVESSKISEPVSNVEIEYLQPSISNLSEVEDKTQERWDETSSGNITQPHEDIPVPIDPERKSTKTSKRVSFSEVPDTIIKLTTTENTPDPKIGSEDLERTKLLPTSETTSSEILFYPTESSEITTEELEPMILNPANQSTFNISEPEDAVLMTHGDSDALGFEDNFVSVLENQEKVDESILIADSSDKKEVEQPPVVLSIELIQKENDEPELIPADTTKTKDEPDLSSKIGLEEKLLPKTSTSTRVEPEELVQIGPSTSENIKFHSTDAPQQEILTQEIAEFDSKQLEAESHEDRPDESYIKLATEENLVCGDSEASPIDEESQSIQGLIGEPENISQEDAALPVGQPIPEFLEVQTELTEEQQPFISKRKKKSRKRKNDKERTPPVEPECVVGDVVKPKAQVDPIHTQIIDASPKMGQASVGIDPELPSSSISPTSDATSQENLQKVLENRTDKKISIVTVSDQNLISGEFPQSILNLVADQEVFKPSEPPDYQTTKKSAEDSPQGTPEESSKKRKGKKKLPHTNGSGLTDSETPEKTLTKQPSLENKRVEDISSVLEQSERGESTAPQKLEIISDSPSSVSAENLGTDEVDLPHRSNLDENEEFTASILAEVLIQQGSVASPPAESFGLDKEPSSSDKIISLKEPENLGSSRDSILESQFLPSAAQPGIVTTELEANSRVSTKIKIFPTPEAQTKSLDATKKIDSKTFPEAEIETHADLEPELTATKNDEDEIETQIFPEGESGSKMPREAAIEANVFLQNEIETKTIREEQVETKAPPKIPVETNLLVEAQIQTKLDPEAELETKVQVEAEFTSDRRPRREKKSKILPETQILGAEDKFKMPSGGGQKKTAPETSVVTSIPTQPRIEAETEPGAQKDTDETEIISHLETMKMPASVDAETLMKAEADYVTKMQLEETETTVQPEIQMESKVYSKTKVDSKIHPKAAIETKMFTSVEAGTKIQSEAEFETKPQPESKIETKIESDAEIKTKIEPQVEIETKEEPEAEIETKMQPEAEIESRIEPEAEIETRLQAVAEIKTKPHQATEIETKTQPEAKIKTKINPDEIETKTEQKVEIENKIQAETEIKPKLQPETKIEAIAQPKAEIETQIQREAEITKTQPETKIESKIIPDTEIETKIQPEVEIETKPQRETKIEETKTQSDIEIKTVQQQGTKMQPEAEIEDNIQRDAEIETKMQSEAEIEAERQPESEAENKIEPQAEIETKPQQETEIQTKIQPEAEIETKIQPVAEVEIETKIHPDVEIETEIQPDAEIGPIIRPEAEMQPEAQMRKLQSEDEPIMQAKVSILPKTLTGAEIETKVDPRPKVEIKMLTSVETETKRHPESEIETKMDLETPTEAKVDAETTIKPEPVTKTEMYQKVEIETKKHTKPETRILLPKATAKSSSSTPLEMKTEVEIEGIQAEAENNMEKKIPIEPSEILTPVETESKMQSEDEIEKMKSEAKAETKMPTKAPVEPAMLIPTEIETEMLMEAPVESKMLIPAELEAKLHEEDEVEKMKSEAEAETKTYPDTEIDTKAHAKGETLPQPETEEPTMQQESEFETKMHPEIEMKKKLLPERRIEEQRIPGDTVESNEPKEAKDKAEGLESEMETKIPVESETEAKMLHEAEIRMEPCLDAEIESETIHETEMKDKTEIKDPLQDTRDVDHELDKISSEFEPTVSSIPSTISTEEVESETGPLPLTDMESRLSSAEPTDDDKTGGTALQKAIADTDQAKSDMDALSEVGEDDASHKLKPELGSELTLPDSSNLENQITKSITNKLKDFKQLHSSREKPVTIPRLTNFEDSLNKMNELMNNISTTRSAVISQNVNDVDPSDFVDNTCSILDNIATAIGTIENRLHLLNNSDSTIPIEARKIEQGILAEQLQKLSEELDNIQKHSQSIPCLDASAKEELEDVVGITENDLKKLKKSIQESIDATKAVENNLKVVTAGLNESIVKLNEVEMLLQDNANDSDVSTDARMSQLDNIESQFNNAKLILEKELVKASELATTNPDSGLTKNIQRARDTILRLDQLILSENSRITQDVSLSEEYEQTLKDFSQVIEVAETILNGKLHVQNLDHLHEELDKHRIFFGNFKKCQLTLEKLENDLDDSTKERHQNLHRELYEKASAILDRAARRRQQMAVSTARWARLEQGLQDELAWLATLTNKIPNINSVSSSDLERYCGLYQSFYSDIIVHQARLLQLRTISESLSEVVECSELKGICDNPIDSLLAISGNITASLQSLIGFRDTFSNYERHLHRLKAWLQRAEARMDSLALQTESHPYEFWELKAQLESQQPLRNEAYLLLNQSLKILSVTDEETIREVFENFDERWLALSTSIRQAENSMHYSDPSDVPSLETIFTEVETDITEMQAEIENMTVVVESEDDFYIYLEKLQILKAQILNKQHQLNSLLPKEGEEEDFNVEHFEKIGSYLSTLGQIEGRINEELETSHVIREQFAKFNRMSLKIKRTQDTLRARVDQWASFFELSQDILKQAVENYQRIDDDIANTRGDLEKAHDVLQNFPSTPHISISTAKLDNELREMDAVIHTLSARIQDLRIRVQEQLGIWQDYEHGLSTALQLVYHNQSTLQLLLSEPPASIQSLIASQHYLQGVEEVLGDKTCLNSLQIIADKLKSDSPEEVSRQIDKSVQNIVLEWEEAGNLLSEAKVKYSTGKEIWDRVLPLQRKLDDWIEEFYPQVELGANESVLLRLQEELPGYESIMNELQALSTELCTTLFSSPENATSSSERFPLNLELRILQKKIEFMRTCVSCPIARTKADLIDESRRMLENVAQVLKRENKSLLSPTRLGEVQQQLINIGCTEGRLLALAAQTSSSNNDSEVTELLDSSKTIFQEAFTEYLKMWTSMTEKNETIELYKLWQNYVDEIEKYLAEPLPSTREQLVEDSSLCSVYHSILNGQYEPLSLAMKKQSLNLDALQDLHTKVEEKLKERQVELKDRLNRWKTFEKSQESFSSWLRVMEKEKRALELSFLQLSRLPATLRKIEDLVGKCGRGEELLEDFKKATSELVATCPPTLKLSLVHDLSSHSSMFSNLQAALKTWLDHVARINSANETFKLKEEQIQLSLDNIRQRLIDHVVPSTFTGLSEHVSKIKLLQEEINNIPLDELQSCLNSMTAAISPTDTRILSQKIWYFNQQQVELLTILGQDLSSAQERLDLLPRFDTKCKRWMVWVDAMQEKVEFPLTQNLETYTYWIDKDLPSELEPKEEEFQWLIETGNELAEFTQGKELQEFVKVLEAARSKWDRLNSTAAQRSKQANHLIQTLQNLNDRIEAELKKLRTFENFITSPIQLQDWNPEFINEAVRALDNEERKLKSEGTEIHQILTLTELVAADCEGLRFHQDASSARRSLDTLQDRWNDLLVRFDQRKQFLYLLRDDIRKIHDGCDYLETLLSQVDCDITTLENDDESSSGTDGEQESSRIESLLASLEALAPKVQELNKEYGFAARKVTSLNSCLQKRLKRIKMDLNNLKKRGEDCRRKRRRMSVLTQFTSSYEFNRQFMDSISEKLKNLSKLDDPEQLRAELKRLKLKCRENRQNEESLKHLVNSVTTVDPSIRTQIASQMNSYNSLKKELEKLFKSSVKDLLKGKSTGPATKENIERSASAITDASVQVSTLPFERDFDTQVETLLLDESNNLFGEPGSAETDSEWNLLTRSDIYLQEFSKSIHDLQGRLEALRSLLSKDKEMNEIENGHLIEILALAQTSMDTAQHLFRLLENENLPQDRNATAALLAEMENALAEYELDIRKLGEKAVELSAIKRLTCPVCSPSQRGVWDSTLWRLEQWLQYADATLTNIMRRHPPNDLEHLEDCVLSHRELLLDMDSHRSLVQSLTEVLDHLNGHEENTKTELHERLDRTLRWWKDICHRAAAWQARLQMALIENSDFHSTIRQFEIFISSVQEAVTELEPVDLSELHLARVKLRSFQELSERLLKAEPELKTLQQSAEQLFVNAASIEKDGLFRASRGSIESIFTTPEYSLVLQRVGTLDRELNSLLRVSEAYVKHLSAFLAQNPGEDFDESLEPSERVLLLPETITGRSVARNCNPEQSTAHKDEDLKQSHKSYLVRGSRFVYRVVRASLPIQALMILLLGASSLLPYSEQDYSCATANSFARSLEPMLRYPNGPPPI